MQWTENLDPIFVSNYEMDPVLSWQYFGSTKGSLRRFPSKYSYTGVVSRQFYYIRVEMFYSNSLRYIIILNINIKQEHFSF